MFVGIFLKVIMEKTLAIIKPDAVQSHYIGAIISRIEQEQFTIRDMKMIHISKKEAESFYEIHKDRPFFGELVEFMISGPSVVIALEKDNGVKAWRDLMGSTNPAEAAPNTLRKLYGKSIGSNATHGSDSIENGIREVHFFFPNL
jgi:nucleoside-diphosphate kinase